MNAFKKTLVAIAAATLGACALTSTQASAWCGEYGSYSYSPYYSYDSYYDDSRSDRHDRSDFRGHDHRESRRH